MWGRWSRKGSNARSRIKNCCWKSPWESLKKRRRLLSRIGLIWRKCKRNSKLSLSSNHSSRPPTRDHASQYHPTTQRTFSPKWKRSKPKRHWPKWPNVKWTTTNVLCNLKDSRKRTAPPFKRSFLQWRATLRIWPTSWSQKDKERPNRPSTWSIISPRKARLITLLKKLVSRSNHVQAVISISKRNTSALDLLWRKVSIAQSCLIVCLNVLLVIG